VKHPAEVNPPETASLRLHSLPAARTCPGRVGLLRRHEATHRASNAGAYTFGILRGSLWYRLVPNVVAVSPPTHPPAICHREITGALSLLLPRLILPSGRGSCALTSLYQSSRKLSTTRPRRHGHKSPGGCAHTHTRARAHTHTHTPHIHTSDTHGV